MYHIVWFKRDLRTVDHAALAQASQSGTVIPLYIVEPELWQQADMSQRHYGFLCECIADLQQQLSALGYQLIIKVGDAVSTLAALNNHHPIQTLWSHQETWNHWTYERDRAVTQWCQTNNIQWHEPPQNGVVRCLDSRDRWQKHWQHFMQQPIVATPTTKTILAIDSDDMPSATSLGLHDDDAPLRQQGGRQLGLATLQQFLYERGETYTKAMSSPVTAFQACSRLSPHLAFGTISIREVYQAARQRQTEIKQLPSDQRGYWLSALRSFISRLHWHCHFIQKLESEPRIEFTNIHPAYDTIRQDAIDIAKLHAWKSGMTGYPLIDACMRALHTTGWINFRMRAMLMSFASYHLWLHWREPALHLAKLFTDYEPGIHYSQCQMQSGTTGMNAIRIYNPIKQSQDQDPQGDFIRQWVPEIAHFSAETIHMPWLYPNRLNGYPVPIVDEKTARQQAAAQVYGVRKNDGFKAQAQLLIKRHANRKSSASSRKQRRKTDPAQGELLF